MKDQPKNQVKTHKSKLQKNLKSLTFENVHKAPYAHMRRCVIFGTLS